MVSDFIEEHNGYLRMAPEEHAIAKLAHPNLLWKQGLYLSLEH